jgi:nucleotide-binding universal stress UspA family protein
MSIDTILCPIDFSAASEGALRYAVSIAAKLGATQIHVLHAHQPPSVALPDGSLVPDRAAEAKQLAARELEAVAKRYSAHDVSVTPHLTEGAPYQSIVEHARALGADLVVMGTHGRTGLKHALLGSVAERVVRLSDVPVCTVRSPR